jgi:hypothetical protein
MSGRFGSTSYPRGLSTDLDVVGRYPGHRQRSPTSVYERHQREGGALGAGSTPVAERHQRSSPTARSPVPIRTPARVTSPSKSPGVKNTSRMSKTNASTIEMVDVHTSARTSESLQIRASVRSLADTVKRVG